MIPNSLIPHARCSTAFQTFNINGRIVKIITYTINIVPHPEYLDLYLHFSYTP
jgi:hypothetical protein